jgi:hypothetical protein
MGSLGCCSPTSKPLRKTISSTPTATQSAHCLLRRRVTAVPCRLRPLPQASQRYKKAWLSTLSLPDAARARSVRAVHELLPRSPGRHMRGAQAPVELRNVVARHVQVKHDTQRLTLRHGCQKGSARGILGDRVARRFKEPAIAVRTSASSSTSAINVFGQRKPLSNGHSRLSVP